MIYTRYLTSTQRRLALSLVAAACALYTPSAFADNTRPFWIGISALQLVHHNSQDEIDKGMRSAGYSSIGTNQPIRGVAFDLGLARWRLSWDIGLWGKRSFDRHSDGQSFAVRQANVSIDTGVDVIQYRGFSVFPMVGLAGGDLRFDIEARKTPIIYEQIGGVDGTFELRQNTWSARILAGVEQRYPIHDQVSLLFGLRIGYQKQFLHSEWILDDPDRISLHGGPSVDVSGPFVRFAIGIAN